MTRATGREPTGREPTLQLGSEARLIHPDDVAAAVAERTGGLLEHEDLLLYGAMQAAASGIDAAAALLPAERVADLANVLLKGRAGACEFCGKPLSTHTLGADSESASVWCEVAVSPRPVSQWLAGPVRLSPGALLEGTLLWVGVPGLSLGLLSWLPSLIAGVQRKRRSWLVAAATWAALLFAGISLSSPGATGGVQETGSGLLILGVWLGSTIHGGFQVRPWLEGRRRTRTQWPPPRPPRPPAMPAAMPTALAGRATADPARRDYDRAVEEWRGRLSRWDFAVWCAQSIAAGQLPGGAVGSPVALRAGESLLWTGPGRLEPRREPGAVVVTSDRLVFAGARRETLEWPLSTLTPVQRASDGTLSLPPIPYRRSVSGVQVLGDHNRFRIAVDVAVVALAEVEKTKLWRDLKSQRDEILLQHPFLQESPARE